MALRPAIAAPLAALIYPAILSCGVHVSAIFVLASLAVPVLGVVAATRPDTPPRARAIAHLVVAAPPLFSLLGGWLDFQHTVPLRSLTVWIPLWCTLVVVAMFERPRPLAPLPERSRRLGIAHGFSAVLIALFALPHLVNHLAGLLGGDVHIAVMGALRRVYRHSVVEAVLLSAVAFQVVSGFWLLRAKLARFTGVVDAIQTASGSYLLWFLLSHVSAALRARIRGVDPDWHWLAGDELLVDPWSVRLVPYYFLAVIALGTHVGCRLATRSATIVVVMAAVATTVSTLILIGLLRA